MTSKKQDIQPQGPAYSFSLAPRCGARTKSRNGKPCLAPAVKGKKRCRVHGGAKGSGAPKGNKNAWKHGEYSAEAKEQAKLLKEAIKKIKNFCDSV